MNNGNKINRRQFVGTAAVATTAAFLQMVIVDSLHTAYAKQSSIQKTKSGIKVGLYSITFLGLWYRGKALTLKEIIERAKKYGYDGIEIDGKRPHGNPNDWPTRHCKELRSIADGEGIDIYSVAANNDFSSPICEHWQSQIVYVRQLIRMTADFGARTLRVFLAWPGVTKHPQIAKYSLARKIWQYTHTLTIDEEDWDRCREGLIESTRYAGDYGITLALQNHAPIIADFKDMLRMIREVNSPHLKACLDLPIMKDKSPENIRRAAQQVGPLQVLSHYGGEFERAPDGAIKNNKGNEPYVHFIRAMKEIGYNGYIGYELCHPLPVVDGKTVGIEYAEKNAQMAAEFMRDLLNSVHG